MTTPGFLRLYRLALQARTSRQLLRPGTLFLIWAFGGAIGPVTWSLAIALLMAAAMLFAATLLTDQTGFATFTRTLPISRSAAWGAAYAADLSLAFGGAFVASPLGLAVYAKAMGHTWPALFWALGGAVLLANSVPWRPLRYLALTIPLTVSPALATGKGNLVAAAALAAAVVHGVRLWRRTPVAGASGHAAGRGFYWALPRALARRPTAFFVAQPLTAFAAVVSLGMGVAVLRDGFEGLFGYAFLAALAGTAYGEFVVGPQFAFLSVRPVSRRWLRASPLLLAAALGLLPAAVRAARALWLDEARIDRIVMSQAESENALDRCVDEASCRHAYGAVFSDLMQLGPRPDVRAAGFVRPAPQSGAGVPFRVGPTFAAAYVRRLIEKAAWLGGLTILTLIAAALVALLPLGGRRLRRVFAALVGLAAGVLLLLLSSLAAETDFVRRARLAWALLPVGLFLLSWRLKSVEPRPT